MAMDEALEKISAKEFDIQVAARRHREEKERQSKLTLAQAAFQRREFAVGTRLWAEALASDPKLGDDLQAQHRHHAAGCAAMAGVGQGDDDPRPDAAARSRFRAQARDWIRADLGLCSKMLDTGNAKDRDVVVQALQHWKVCPNLAGIRDAEALARLPEPERKEWRSLWADFDTLLERAQGHPAKTVAAASPMPAKAPEPVPNPTAVDVNTVLGDLRQAGNGPLADKLTQEIQQAQDRLELSRKRNPRSTGHVIVGRVICEGGDDPSRVVSQMRIHSEGYFVGPVKESGRPVGFRRQGYLPAQITPVGRARLGRVRRRGPPQANDRVDGLGRAGRSSSTAKSPRRRSQRGFRLASARSTRRQVGLKALPIPCQRAGAERPGPSACTCDTGDLPRSCAPGVAGASSSTLRPRSGRGPRRRRAGAAGPARLARATAGSAGGATERASVRTSCESRGAIPAANFALTVSMNIRAMRPWPRVPGCRTSARKKRVQGVPRMQPVELPALDQGVLGAQDVGGAGGEVEVDQGDPGIVRGERPDLRVEPADGRGEGVGHGGRQAALAERPGEFRQVADVRERDQDELDLRAGLEDGPDGQPVVGQGPGQRRSRRPDGIGPLHGIDEVIAADEEDDDARPRRGRPGRPARCADPSRSGRRSSRRSGPS